MSTDLTDREYVTFEIAGAWFGADVSRVHDVFQLRGLTPVPLAPRQIAGLMNLRGRVVTAVDARTRLGLPANTQTGVPMAIGVEKGGESYGLVVDNVGEVLRPNSDSFEENPVNLDPLWRDVARGVFRLDGRLLIVVDVDRMIDLAEPASTLAA